MLSQPPQKTRVPNQPSSDSKKSKAPNQPKSMWWPTFL